MKGTYQIISLVLLAALATTGCTTLMSSSPQGLQASGVIEATEIAVSSELPGRVVEVTVAESDAVKSGQVLFRLDDTLLQAQRQAAAAGLASAKASQQTAQAAQQAAQVEYQAALSRALAAAQPGRTAAWNQANPPEFDLPGWYFSADERYASTQAAAQAAQTALQAAQADLQNVENKAGSAQFLDAEQRLAEARVAFQLAQDVLNRVSDSAENQDLRQAAQNSLDDARTELEAAQRDYDTAVTSDGAKDVLQARARVAVAQESADRAQDALRALEIGARSPQVTAAASALDQARAAVQQAQAGVDQAQAGLDLLDAQIQKMTVYAPQDGVVLTRSIQPGEVLQAGMTALTIARMDQLTVTVYLPEDRYGQVNLGDPANLSVDSYPGQVFPATVTRIADQAEYTPQNVQTQEGRQTTVYAVQLTIDNSEGKLKPGMPVDVAFSK